jgi:hypothetical protein
MHGVMLIVHHLFRDWCQGRDRLQSMLQSAPGTATRVAFTFLCHSLSLVVFRAMTLGDAWTIFGTLVTSHPGKSEPVAAWGFVVTVLAVVLAHAATRTGLWRRMACRIPAPAMGVLYAVVLSMCLVLAPPTGQPFIYFQF